MDSKTKKIGRYVYLVVKRFFDIISSLLALLLAMPVMLTAVIIIVLETPGSPVFTQIRLGKNKKPFVLYKLRSMYTGSHKKAPAWTDINDSRITKVGTFIRRYHIDELPQFFNVLKGDMSIIGPRPEVPELSDKFESLYPEYGCRLFVKPGLTGLAQVNGGYNLTPEEKAKLDCMYIKNQDFCLDFIIAVKTVAVVLFCWDVR